MSKAFRSIEIGDGPCSIPENPEILAPVQLDCELPEIPESNSEFPFELPLPPPHIFGFGCSLPEINMREPAGIGRLEVSVEPRDVVEADNCFLEWSYRLIIPTVCSDIYLEGPKYCTQEIVGSGTTKACTGGGEINQDLPALTVGVPCPWGGKAGRR